MEKVFYILTRPFYFLLIGHYYQIYQHPFLNLYFEFLLDKQVEINAHYSGYLPKQESDIRTFKKDESLVIPNEIDYDSFSGLSNEVKSKLKLIRPKTLGQALRIDGVTPAAAIILLGAIKKTKHRVPA